MTFKKFVKKIFPKKLLPFIGNIYTLSRRCVNFIYYSIFYKGDDVKCIFCNKTFSKFMPAGNKFNVLVEKKIIGGGYRLNARCPYCLSLDRERLVYLFLKEKKLIQNNMKLLHIAPEYSLEKKITNEPIDYYTADLNSPMVRIKMDIQNIDFESNFFDGIICNHVLEHVDDYKKAMSELFRVLKTNGWAILQVPISPVLNETFEDFSIVKPKDREKIFGQYDHVRIFGTDYVKHLNSVGFQVSKITLDKLLIQNNALNPDEVVYFSKK